MCQPISEVRVNNRDRDGVAHTNRDKLSCHDTYGLFIHLRNLPSEVVTVVDYSLTNNSRGRCKGGRETGPEAKVAVVGGSQCSVTMQKQIEEG